MFGGSKGLVNLGGGRGPTTSGTPLSSFISQTTGGPVNTSTPVTIPGSRITFTPGKPQFFGNPALTGGLLPGTLPASFNPLALYKGPYATDLLAQNPNLSPTILGGTEGLGYYTDRLGNKIFSPGSGYFFADGGEVDKEQEPETEADPASAQAALRKLLESAPAETQTEVQMSPNARSVKRTSAKSVDKGGMKGMSFKMEEAKVASGETARDQLAALGEQYKEKLRQLDNSARGLMRSTFDQPTFDRPGLAGRGPLTKRRFNDGGEAESSKGMMERMFNALPLQVKTYAESVSKEDKRRAPITEKSLSAQELDKLRELISIAESNPVLSEKTGRPLPGVVDYAHHREQIRRHNPSTGMPLAMLDTDFNVGESGNLRNTLGAFRFERLPDGSYVVKDQYDYTGDAGEKMNPLVKYANRVGVNRPVQIMLSPVKGKK